MLLVKTKLNVSPIDGIGLFAIEDIPKNTVIWRFCSLIDRRFPEVEFKNLAAPSREQIIKYSYREKYSGLYVLCGDDARFFNHSANPNCFDTGENQDQDLTIACRDIRAGDELTCDYGLFDLDFSQGKYKLSD